jgi:spore germination protein KA
MSLLSDGLQDTIDLVRKEFGDSADIIIRIVQSGLPQKRDAALLFTNGLANTKDIQQFVMEPLMAHLEEEQAAVHGSDQIMITLQKAVLTAASSKEIDKLEDLLEGMLSGQVIVLVDGCHTALSIDMAGWKERNVTESDSQTVVRGPREAFTENVRTNTALVRRKIKDQRLRVENMQVGKVTKTTLALLYIEEAADSKVVQEVRDRLTRIEIDSVLESAYIEEQIEEKRLTPFPTVFNSERPDVIAAGLLEGRVAIIVDGTPYVLMVPALFVQFYSRPKIIINVPI